MWGRDSYRRPVCKGCTNDWWYSGTSSDGGHISSIWKKLAPELRATTKDTKEEEAKGTARFYKLIIMYPNKVCPAHHITWIAPHLISAIRRSPTTFFHVRHNPVMRPSNYKAASQWHRAASFHSWDHRTGFKFHSLLPVKTVGLTFGW